MHSGHLHRGAEVARDDPLAVTVAKENAHCAAQMAPARACKPAQRSTRKAANSGGDKGCEQSGAGAIEECAQAAGKEGIAHDSVDTSTRVHRASSRQSPEPLLRKGSACVGGVSDAAVQRQLQHLPRWVARVTRNLPVDRLPMLRECLDVGERQGCGGEIRRF